MVFRVPGFRLPSYARDLAYKELLPTLPPAAKKDFLDSAQAAFEFRERLGAADRADLDEYTTWPLAMVQNSGGLCGLLMPLIPSAFFVRTNPRNGGIQPKDLPFDLSWLSAREEQAQIKGIDRSGVRDPLMRVALLTQLVYAVARLHKHGIVYGDLSLKNAVLALNPPRVKLLDCDSAAPMSDPNRRQLHSPFFKPPEIEACRQKLQDAKTDVFKLGLCIIRGMQQGPGSTQTRDPRALRGLLDAAALDAISSAVSPDRSRRPTAAELFIALEDSLLSRASPPAPQFVTLERTQLLRGTDVAVKWFIAGAQSARILGPNGLEIIVADLAQHPHGYVITPRVSGEILVEFENRHGKVTLSAGRVDLIDLPSFDVANLRLPRPVIPTMPNFSIPEVLGQLPGRPLVSTEAHPVPRLETPSLDGLLGQLALNSATMSPLPRVDAAFIEQSHQLQTALNGPGTIGGRTAAASIRAATMAAAEEARGILTSSTAQLRSALENGTDVTQRRATNALPRGAKSGPPGIGQKGINP